MQNGVLSSKAWGFNKRPRFQQIPVCALNRIGDDVRTPLAGIHDLPFASMVVGGATSRGGTSANSGGGRVLVGLGDPNEANIPGHVGDIFQRIDGKLGETFYVKEANGTGRDWKAK